MRYDLTQVTANASSLAILLDLILHGGLILASLSRCMYVCMPAHAGFLLLQHQVSPIACFFSFTRRGTKHLMGDLAFALHGA